MTKIKSITGIEILDSRGTPTIAVRIILESGTIALAMVPSGASTGEHEAVELRDENVSRYFGKGVLKAIRNIHEIIAPELIGHDVYDQEGIDKILIELDGTENKSRLGANATLGVSLAALRAASKNEKKPVFQHLSKGQEISLPLPMMNIINGGAHASNPMDIQEFMIRPIGSQSFKDRIRVASEIFHSLKQILKKCGESTSVGDEGGFAPNFKSGEEAISKIVDAIVDAGYVPGTDVTIALDCAASFMFDTDGYLVDKKGGSKEKRTSHEQVDYLQELCNKFPIDSIEDGLDENDWEGWKILSETLGNKIQIVGDDLFVTNPKFLQKGIDNQIANAILIKPNQIGTLTETFETMKMAKDAGYKCVISHRSGETEDTTIADIAVGTNAGQIKTGSLSRSERIAKYNRLLIIEHAMQESSA